MPFLKSIKAKGFKSFANEVVINFNKNMTSFIGPNGSGKSNVVDAIKWTIGEQSIKQLRGDDKSNLIFMGSKNLEPSNEAFVELTFDNRKRILDIDKDIVVVSRKQIKKNNQNFYYLNGEETKLRDIHELFLDTGLSKGSLGIISQGTINWFSDAKPDERKKIFQDAAGIGKYFKNKLDSINLLEKSSQALEIVTNDLKNKEKRKDELEKLVEKYNEFLEKRNELKECELIFLAKEIGFKRNEINELENNIVELNEKINQLKQQSDFNEKNNKELTTKIKELADKIATKNVLVRDLQEKKNNLNTKLEILNSNLETDLNSENAEKRLEALKIVVSNTNVEIETKQKIVTDSKTKLFQAESEFEKIRNRKNELYEISNSINKQLNETIYELRNLESIAKNNSDKVVKELMNIKNSYSGLVDIVSNLIKVDKKYELAIGTALAKQAKSFVTLEERTALDLISYLKKNQIGNATFLPINKLKSKLLSSDIISIAKNQKGYINTANNLVKIDNKFKIVADHLLGNIIISENLESAAKIADMLDQRFKIITLEGDVKNTGGSITGGFKGNNTIVFNIEEKIEEQRKLFFELESKLNEIKVQIKSNDNDYDTAFSMVSNLKNIINLNETNLKDLNEKLLVNNQLLEQLNNKIKAPKDSIKEVNESKTLKKELIEIENQLAELLPEFKLFTETHERLNNELVLSGNTNNAISKQIIDLMNQKSTFENKKIEDDNLIQAKLQYLVETYEMSEEVLFNDYKNKKTPYSDIELQQKIINLKNDMKALGNINSDVIQEYEQMLEEFSLKEKEYNDAKDAVDQIQQTINQLDNKAKTDLVKTINDINKTAPEVFKRFYPGIETGTCQIKFVDEENILDSGIEVLVQLPGKKRINLSLLSGGEKTLVALTILFSILKSSKFPLIILDEAEAALDELNVEFFASIIKEYSATNQFLIITHRTGTMKVTEELYGVTMQDQGVTIIIKDTIKNFNKYIKEEVN